MATNPMQRRSRNSFLLGMLVTTLVLGGVVAFLVFMMTNLQNEKKELQAQSVYILKKDVKSGDELTEADLESIKVPAKMSPSTKVIPSTHFFEDMNDGTQRRKKVIVKTDLSHGVIVTTDMLYIDATTTGKDVRKQEYNTVIMPMDLVTGDYIDVRLVLPSGQDFIVVSKKKVEIPQVNGIDSSTTMYIELAEEETLAMSNAIVEAYMVNGSKLYAAKYTDPGRQDAVEPTYTVNQAVRTLMNNNPNIETEAKKALADRYNNAGANEIRNQYINSALGEQEEALENEQERMQESITNSINERDEYLQSLGGATVTQ